MNIIFKELAAPKVLKPSETKADFDCYFGIDLADEDENQGLVLKNYNNKLMHGLCRNLKCL